MTSIDVRHEEVYDCPVNSTQTPEQREDVVHNVLGSLLGVVDFVRDRLPKHGVPGQNTTLEDWFANKRNDPNPDLETWVG